MKIYLVDEIMSSGKSYWIMEKMREWNAQKKFDQFVYLSPLLTEVGGTKNLDGKYDNGRIQQQLPEMNFKYPVPVLGSKSKHAKHLIHQCKNISATHNLFLNLDKSCSELIKDYRNILIIDECLDAYKQFTKISKKTLTHFIRDGVFIVDAETSKMTYNHDKYPLKQNERWEYLDLVELCDTGCVFCINDEVVIWEYPVEILEAFTEVWVMTYLFEGSFMSMWCKINNVEVERVRPQLNRSTKEVKAYIKDCIELVDTPSLTKIQNFSYSQTWWSNDAVESVVDKIRKAIESCVKLIGCKSADILVTCPKLNWEPTSEDKYTDDYAINVGKIKKRPLIKGKGFTRACWLYSDAKATNDFSDKTVLIYLLGKSPHTMLYNFCHSKGHILDKELFAIASIVQWIFRGSVRKQEKMYLIMPSKAMRDLYNKWLDTEDEELVNGK